MICVRWRKINERTWEWVCFQEEELENEIMNIQIFNGDENKPESFIVNDKILSRVVKQKMLTSKIKIVKQSKRIINRTGIKDLCSLTSLLSQ